MSPQDRDGSGPMTTPTTTPNYRHGDLVRIKADDQIAMVDYYSHREGLVYIFDALAHYNSMAFHLDEVEPLEETS